MKSDSRDIAPSTAIGCCVFVLLVWLAWMAVLWWATGILVDWANIRYNMGLTGSVVFVFHLLTFLLLGSFTSVAGRIVNPRRG